MPEVNKKTRSKNTRRADTTDGDSKDAENSRMMQLSNRADTGRSSLTYETASQKSHWTTQNMATVTRTIRSDPGPASKHSGKLSKMQPY